MTKSKSRPNFLKQILTTISTLTTQPIAMSRLLLMLVCCVCLLGGKSAKALARSAMPQDRLNEPWWAQRHESVLEQVHQHPDTPLLLLGDSITNNYDKITLPDENFRPTWDLFYAKRGALNLGFSGDDTSNLLWRLQHGEVDGLHPKVAVLLIGTNNTGRSGESSEETEVGIDAVIAELEQRLPNTHLLVLGILPSAMETASRNNSVNRYLAACYGENAHVSYLDIGSIFFANGHLREELFYDPRLPQHYPAVHPDTHGQRMMAEAIEPTLARLMGDAPAMPLESMTDLNTGLVAVPWLEQDSYDWYARHHAALNTKQEMLDISAQPATVLIGDSITHFWSGSPISAQSRGAEAWRKAFGDSRVLNLGFGWDRTQNVLWRLRQGEFHGLRPGNIVINLGTNNLTGSSHARANTPEETAEAIEAVCRLLHQESPGSRVFLMAIFPRGDSPGSSLRKSIAMTNQLLRAFALKQTFVTYLDLGSRFLLPNDSLDHTLLPDGTHPNEAGYQIWADALLHEGLRR